MMIVLAELEILEAVECKPQPPEAMELLELLVDKLAPNLFGPNLNHHRNPRIDPTIDPKNETNQQRPRKRCNLEIPGGRSIGMLLG